MKTLIYFVMCMGALSSCTKNEDILAKPIKKDVTAPSVAMLEPNSPMSKNSTCTATINATDDMGLKAVYYYENDVLSRTWTSNGNPGTTATNWTFSFTFCMTSDIMNVRIVCIDLSGNLTEITKTITI